jgi:hypothetical protein
MLVTVEVPDALAKALELDGVDPERSLESSRVSTLGIFLDKDISKRTLPKISIMTSLSCNREDLPDPAMTDLTNPAMTD